MGCLFCNIIEGKTPSTKIYEDDFVYAFEDINPQSPSHTLVIPKMHITDINQLDEDNCNIMSKVFLAVKKVAEIKELKENGYRVIINNGKAAGQVIWHIHVHVMGGQENLGPMLSK